MVLDNPDSSTAHALRHNSSRNGFGFHVEILLQGKSILQDIYSIYLYGTIWLLWEFAERKEILQTPCVWGKNSFADKISNGLWVQVESQLHMIRVAVQTLLCPKQSLYTAGH